MVSLISIALLLATPGRGDATPPGVTGRTTKPAALSTDRLAHHEVLRIDRDFGMPKWELALDGWVPHGNAEVETLALWWVNVEDDDRRKPFAPYLKRYLQFAFEAITDGGLAVKLAGDRKEYAFTVQLDGKGKPVVHATVQLDDGTRVDGCRCERGRLLARRVLGVPIGIASLQVRCTDTTGTVRSGSVVFKTVDGPAYEPGR